MSLGGGELVQSLLYEEVGVPVYKINPGEKRMRVLVDRKAGEEDFTVRQKEERDRKLLGLIIPTQEKNEFVYLGIEEGGFIFQTPDDRASEFYTGTTTSFDLEGERFGDYLVSNLTWKVAEPIKIVLREEQDPDQFMDIVLRSVEYERLRIQLMRDKRAKVRENLLKKLFGKQ